MMNRKMVATLLICLPLVGPGIATSAEQTQLVSMKVINSKGYPAKLKDGTEVRIVGLKNQKEPEKECSVDIGSLRGVTANNWSKAGKGATATIKLQAKVGPKGHPYCSGSGEGCVMTVEVPDAAMLRERINR